MKFGYVHDDVARITAVPMRMVAGAVVSKCEAPTGFKPLMTENDKYGICTFASARNSRRLQEWVKNGTDWNTDTNTIVANFAACAGIPNTDAALASCRGLGLLQVIDWAQASGLNMGNQTIEVPSVEQIMPSDRLTMADAVVKAGWWGGIGLTAQDAQDLQPGAPMLTGVPSGAAIEGHAIIVSGMDGLLDNDRVTIATWDCFIPVTWEWLSSRTLAAYHLSWA